MAIDPSKPPDAVKEFLRVWNLAIDRIEAALSKQEQLDDFLAGWCAGAGPRWYEKGRLENPLFKVGHVAGQEALRDALKAEELRLRDRG